MLHTQAMANRDSTAFWFSYRLDLRSLVLQL